MRRCTASNIFGCGVGSRKKISVQTGGKKLRHKTISSAPLTPQCYISRHIYVRKFSPNPCDDFACQHSCFRNVHGHHVIQIIYIASQKRISICPSPITMRSGESSFSFIIFLWHAQEQPRGIKFQTQGPQREN